MRKSMMLFSLFVIILLFLVSCAPEKPLTDEELSAELSKLPPEELEAVTAKDSGALAGKARVQLTDPNLIKLQRYYRRTVTAAPAPPTCSDTDADAEHPNGRDYFENGTLTWSGGAPSVDACGDETLLRENYCSGIPKGLHLTETVDCQNVGEKNFPEKAAAGMVWKCVDGACKQPLETMKGFKYAYWECYNGEEQNQGGETSCKSSVTWQDYAEQFCKGKCNADNSKCGVNSFSITTECP